MKFKVKPFAIEAMQFETNNEVGSPNMNAIVNWMNQGRDKPNGWHNGTNIFVSTARGEVRADVKDWIVKDSLIQFYVCKPDQFAAKYDPAD